MRGGSRSGIVFSVGRIKLWEPFAKLYISRSRATNRPFRLETTGVFRSSRTKPGCCGTRMRSLSYSCILSLMPRMICWFDFASPRYTSGNIKFSVDGESPTSCLTSFQYCGWDVYWSHATTHHFVRSRPFRGRSTRGTFSPISGNRKVSAHRNISCPLGPIPILVRLMARRAKFSTFRRRMAKEIWPTPPGTGVILETFCKASWKQTSPTMRWPF
mmetsp:Transcript_69600/g.166047  ORF Transcript_69600/g.166047 Transcript_69600/m.166047 type:complete len:215 (-) Transcript_69600:880-1524(-)